MADTTFSAGTVVASTWLNDVNSATYKAASGISFGAPVSRKATQKLADVISVKDFGAVGDGVTDDTAAFNLATQSTVAWSSALQYDIFVPPGKYKITGSVYVRKGQTLRGSGTASYIDCSSTGSNTTPIFVMGSGFIAGVVTADSGGQPVRCENLFTLGGPSGRGVFFCDQPGFSMFNLFISSPGVGLEITGADALISNIEIDQPLIGVAFTGAQNIVFTNFNIFNPNYGIQFGSATRDVTLSAGIIEYPQFAGILFASGSTSIKGVSVGNVNFTMNTQYATFLGYVVNNAGTVEAAFTGCSFRNWFNWAVSHTTGVTCNLAFTGCIFDAIKTASGYTQSTTAKVLNTGPSTSDGTYSFYNCEFRNLLAEIATINDGLTKLNIIGGSVITCDANATSQKRFNVVTVLPMAITVKNVNGFPYVFTSGSNRCANLPWWGASTTWKMGIKGNSQSTGDSYYSASEESMFSVSWQNNAGTKSIYADRVNLWQTPSRTNPGQLTSVVCLGTAPGGAASTTTFSATGSICVSVPFSTSQANFAFLADTAV